MLKTAVLFVSALFLINAVVSSAHAGYVTGILVGRAIGKSQCRTEKPKERYLIIQYAHKASLEKSSTPGAFKLTLHDVLPYATAFTQRPIRKVELITLDKLLHLWGNKDPNGFSKNPPNAALNAFVEGSGSEEHQNFFVQLLEPVYDAQKRTLTYTLKTLDGNPTELPDSAMLGHVNLFIDDICLNCWWPQ